MNKLTVFGAVIVLILVLCALSASFISPYDPAEQNIFNRLKSPSIAHPLGTDELGRDIMSRIVWGSRVSVKVGFIAVAIFISIGIVLGAVSGYYGGIIDSVVMRLVDIMLCFPTFFLILMVIAVLEPNITNVMVVIGLTSWPGVARLVRAEILSLKERDFVLAGKALGVSNSRIIFFSILPNAIAPVIVAGTLGVADAILAEAALSFLGLGVQPPTPSWGNILTSGLDYISYAWWIIIFPGVAIFVTVMGFNLLGEGLREILDPRIRERT